MTEPTASTAEKPRDVYGVLALFGTRAAGTMWSGIRPTVDAWRLIVSQRRDIETQVAMRAATGSRSGWWAVARLIGVSAVLLAVHNLLWQGITQVQVAGGVVPTPLAGTIGFIVQLLSATLAQLIEPRLWVGVIIAFMVMRFFSSAMWCSELRLLPISSTSVAARIVAVIFAAACVYHLLTYLARIIYWLAVIHLSPAGNSFEFYWPWVVLVGPFYGDKPSASVPQIVMQELIGHSLGIAHIFLSLVFVVVLSIRLRNVVTTAIIWAVASIVVLMAYYFSLRSIHAGVQWLAQKFLAGDAGIMAGNVMMWLMGFALLLIATGLLCRLLDRRILELMEE